MTPVRSSSTRARRASSSRSSRHGTPSSRVDFKGLVRRIGRLGAFCRQGQGRESHRREDVGPRDRIGHEEALVHLISWLRQHRRSASSWRSGTGSFMAARLFRPGAHRRRGHSDPCEALVPLAPLHQPHNLEPIRIVRRRMPEIPQVACFDTAFHQSQSEIASMFALPQEMRDRGVRRYGFHGLSYDYIASVLSEYDPRLAEGRVIVAHLGNGASLCALKGGASVATTMGFSALDGLPMGTRCGAVDAGGYLLHAAGDEAYARGGRARALHQVRPARGFGNLERYADSALEG